MVKRRRDAGKKGGDWEEGRKRRARWRPACRGWNQGERDGQTEGGRTKVTGETPSWCETDKRCWRR